MVPYRIIPLRSNIRSNIPRSQPDTSEAIGVSSDGASLVCSEPPTLVLGECDHSIATVMTTSADTLDVGPSLVPAANLSPIPAPTIPNIDNAVLSSCN